MDTNFTALIEKHLTASLTAAEAATLARAMAENPALAEEFAAATRMDAELAAATKEVGRTVLYTRRMERASAEAAPLRVRRNLPVKTMTAAAGLAVLFGAGWRILEGSGPVGAFAQKGKSGAAKDKRNGGDAIAALGGKLPVMDSAAMKKMLRRFFVPAMDVRRQPVSVALAALQQQWKDTNGGSVAFTLADDLRKRWPRPEDEPVVSLEIPGISLLTNLELLAAQSGLKTIITGDGVNLEEDTRASDAKARTWNIPLSQGTLTAFMRSASSEPDRADADIAWKNAIMSGLTAPGIVRASRPSWMLSPQPEYAAIDFGLQQPVTWNDSFGEQTWFENGLQVTTTDQAQSAAWGLIPAPGSAELSSVVAGDLLASVADVLPAGTQSFSYDSAAFPSEFSNAAGVRFSPDGKQLVAGDANGIVKVWDAATGKLVAPAHSYADYDGDGTIDLNLTSSDVVEFEGFINYIETTGINTLGDGEPVVLTDSKILEPVFATRTLIEDHPGNLTRLLAVHGMPASGATWSQETGVLTARGTMQSLRAAHAAVAAINESALAGVAVDMRIIEWKDGQPLPGIAPDMILPPADAPMILTATEANYLLRLPGAIVTSAPRVREAMGKPVAVHQMSRHPAPDNEKLPDDYKAWTNANFSRLERLAGDSFNVQVSIEHSGVSGYEEKEGVRSPVRATRSSSTSCKVPDGAWVRTDFPAQGTASAATVLLNIQTAEVQPE